MLSVVHDLHQIFGNRPYEALKHGAVLMKHGSIAVIPESRHQARKYGKSKFGISRFFHGYLDLMSLWFLSKFGYRPMHIFGLWGTLMFFIGFISAAILGASKLYALANGIPFRLVTDSPYFYISLTMMILGTQLFLTGFLAELVSRTSTERNKYNIAKEI